MVTSTNTACKNLHQISLAENSLGEKKKKQPKKRVHFHSDDAVKVHIRHIAELDEACKSKLFYKQRDYNMMKKNAFLVMERDNRNYETTLLAEQIPGSLHRFQSFDANRGLERWACPSLDKARRARRTAAVQTVLQMQHMLANTCGYPRRAALIARAYQQLSSPAKHFARMFGEADAAAVFAHNTLLHKKEDTTAIVSCRSGFEKSHAGGAENKKAFATTRCRLLPSDRRYTGRFLRFRNKLPVGCQKD